jgi:hypothetical protein
MQTPLQLPDAIATYFAADKSKNSQLFSNCFATDALVRDENHDYQGLDAIQAWKREAQAKYEYEVEPLHATVTGQTVTVHARVSGTFPGSPIELRYDFTLADDKITVLEIH